MTVAGQHKVVVGLGNIGKRYEKTRHNIGFMVIDRLASKCGIALAENSRFHAYAGRARKGDATLHLLKPTTFMNESGRAVRKYLDYFSLPPSALCVVIDDAALPFGELRLRSSGSSGGHNGLVSIERHLGTRQYTRLRIGISGKHFGRKPLEDYVLENFTGSESIELPRIIDDAAKTLEKLLVCDVDHVMKEVNTRVKQVPKKGQEINDESDRKKPL